MESVRGTSYFLQVIWGKQRGIPESNHPYPLDPRRWHWVGWQTQPHPALWFCSPQCQISFVCSSFVCLFLSSGHAHRCFELICVCSGPKLHLHPLPPRSSHHHSLSVSLGFSINLPRPFAALSKVF